LVRSSGAPSRAVLLKFFKRLGLGSDLGLLCGLNAKARLGSRALSGLFASSSILPNGPKLVRQLFSTFISCVLNELICFGEAGGLDKVFVGFLGV
jgi:hypothetical protein